MNFAFCRTRKKIENAEASLLPKTGRSLPCCCVCEAVQQARRKQSTVIERLSPTCKDEPTPFRCPGPHSPSKVEGVAGTIAMGRSLQHPDQMNPQLITMSCGESLVSSITQSFSSRLATGDKAELRGLFSTLPCARSPR